MKKNKDFLSDQHGGVMILFAFALVTMIIIMGVSIEMGRIFLLRTKAFNALDTATLAAASIATKGISEETLRLRAEPFFNANFPAGYLGSTGQDSLSVEFRNGVVTGDVTMNMDLFFGKFLPFDNIDVPVTTQVSRKTQNVEIALALDHTPSMCTPDQDCKNPSLWVGLKDAMKLMRTMLNGPGAGVDSQNIFYSYIPFNHTVRIDGEPIYETEDGREQSVQNLPNALGLTPNIGGIIETMDKEVDMKRGDEGGTNAAIGTYYAWMSLRPQSTDLFPGTSAPEHEPMPLYYQPDFDENDPTYKYLLLLTDGINQYWIRNRPYTDVIANQQMSDYCRLAQQEGITIYAIGYGDVVRNNRNTRQLLAGCASSPDHFFLPRTPADLIRVFERISRAISSLLISQ